MAVAVAVVFLALSIPELSVSVSVSMSMMWPSSGPLLLLCLFATATATASVGGTRPYSSQPHSKDDTGHCIWYGKCGQDPAAPPSHKHRTLNCLYEGAAKEASSKDVRILEQVCPHLARELRSPQGSIKLCCDTAQLLDIESSFQLPDNLMGRCPACLANFRKNFCDLTCRPDQSKFANITKRINAPGTDGTTACLTSIIVLQFK